MSTEIEHLPINNRAHDEYFEKFNTLDGRARTAIEVLTTGELSEQYVITPDELAARMDSEIQGVEFDANNLRTNDVLSDLADLGSIYVQDAFDHVGDDLIRLHRPMLEWQAESMSGMPTTPTGKAQDISAYLGASLRTGEPPEPLAAWWYAVLPDGIEFVRPYVDVVVVGRPPTDEDGWVASYPLAEYLLDEWADHCYEYVIHLRVQAQELLAQPFNDYEIRKQLRNQTATALYKSYTNFIVSRVQTELAQLNGDESEGKDPVRECFDTHVDLQHEANRLEIASYYRKPKAND